MEIDLSSDACPNCGKKMRLKRRFANHESLKCDCGIWIHRSVVAGRDWTATAEQMRKRSDDYARSYLRMTDVPTTVDIADFASACNVLADLCDFAERIKRERTRDE